MQCFLNSKKLSFFILFISQLQNSFIIPFYQLLHLITPTSHRIHANYTRKNHKHTAIKIIQTTNKTVYVVISCGLTYAPRATTGGIKNWLLKKLVEYYPHAGEGRRSRHGPDLRPQVASFCVCLGVVEDRSQSVRITSQLKAFYSLLYTTRYSNAFVFSFCANLTFLWWWTTEVFNCVGWSFFFVLVKMDICTKMVHESLFDFGDEICKFLGNLNIYYSLIYMYMKYSTYKFLKPKNLFYNCGIKVTENII